MTQSKISIVTPFYNEASGVDLYFSRIFEVCDQNKEYNFEIICIDDGSKDDTLLLLKSAAEFDRRIIVVELSRNFGKESALTAGLDFATGDAVIPIDADLQDPPEVIPKLIEAWRKGFEVVLARRTDRNTDTFLKRKTAEGFYRFHNRISNLQIPENVGDFRLIDRKVVDALRLLPERQRFMKGLFSWVGFRTEIIDYVRAPRSSGKTKFSGWALWNLALEGITSFSTAPLKIWMYIGFLGSVGTLIYGSFIILNTLVMGVEVPGYASILVSILFFGSLHLIGLGMIGEYIGRIYIESKQRPSYIVRTVYGVLIPNDKLKERKNEP